MAGSPTWAPSSLITLTTIFEPYGLFFSIKVRQQRENERPDVWQMVKPVEEIHLRHLMLCEITYF